MDVDVIAESRDDSRFHATETPERSEAETEGEEEEADSGPILRVTGSQNGTKDTVQKKDVASSPPPVRELPFSKKSANPPTPNDGDETEGESEEDEL